MRAFLKQFGLFIAIQLALTLVIVWSYRRQFPVHQNYLAGSIDKQALIRTQAPPRIIFIGGSSMALGLDSARVAEACGRRPVNMGLHAALGLKFMLNEVRPHIRSGDWIVVAPEYQQFIRTSGQSEMLMNMLEVNPANARLLDRSQWAMALDRGIIQRFGKVVRSVIGRPGRFFRKNTIGRTRLYYRRGGFNANGDMVAHWNVKSPGVKEREFTFRYRPELVRDGISLINEFARFAQARGVTVFFSHPPLPREVYDPNRAQIDPLEKQLNAGLIVPRLDTVEELVFPLADFFDTWYHLAGSGVERRSQLLASRLAEKARGSPPQ